MCRDTRHSTTTSSHPQSTEPRRTSSSACGDGPIWLPRPTNRASLNCDWLASAPVDSLGRAHSRAAGHPIATSMRRRSSSFSLQSSYRGERRKRRQCGLARRPPMKSNLRCACRKQLCRKTSSIGRHSPPASKQAQVMCSGPIWRVHLPTPKDTYGTHLTSLRRIRVAQRLRADHHRRLQANQRLRRQGVLQGLPPSLPQERVCLDSCGLVRMDGSIAPSHVTFAKGIICARRCRCLHCRVRNGRGNSA